MHLARNSSQRLQSYGLTALRRRSSGMSERQTDQRVTDAEFIGVVDTATLILPTIHENGSDGVTERENHWVGSISRR